MIRKIDIINYIKNNIKIEKDFNGYEFDSIDIDDLIDFIKNYDINNYINKETE